jgi:carbon-monoxide dehydrogenase small subunit
MAGVDQGQMTTTTGAKQEFSLIVNGETRTLHAYPMERLLDVLRGQLGLTGTKEGCGEGECGSCSVLMDGVLVNSCLVPVGQAQGSDILTIEGFERFDGDSRMRALQEAFLQLGGAQCGICTPGMIVAACYLLRENPQPSIDAIREGLAGNLCRCTGYAQILEAVAEAARRSPEYRTET